MAILCATDFSPEAIAATAAAAELARHRAEVLWLVFVMPDHSAKAFGDAVLTTAKERLDGEAARVRQLGANVKTALLMGKLHHELPRFALENEVGLVVTGDTRKATHFLGTGTLARLAQHLEVPLWVVRDPAPLIAWAKGERPLKVLLAMDRTPSTEIAARWLSKLGHYGKLEVIAGHVFWPTVEAQRMGLPRPRTWDEERPEVQEALHREMLQMLPPGMISRVRLVPALGRASDYLNVLAAEEGVDLLVLGTHRRQALGQLWSVSEQCLQLAPMSVVTIPAGTAPARSQGLHRVERVLAASDFSSTSGRAVAWGFSILGPGGSMDLVHVAPVQVDSVEKRVLMDRLLEQLPAEAREHGHTVRVHVLVGADPARAIAEAGERFSSQILCVGSRGHSASLKLLLGSTAQGVLAESRRPVMVVRPPQD